MNECKKTVPGVWNRFKKKTPDFNNSENGSPRKSRQPKKFRATYKSFWVIAINKKGKFMNFLSTEQSRTFGEQCYPTMGNGKMEIFIIEVTQMRSRGLKTFGSSGVASNAARSPSASATCNAIHAFTCRIKRTVPCNHPIHHPHWQQTK